MVTASAIDRESGLLTVHVLPAVGHSSRAWRLTRGRRWRIEWWRSVVLTVMSQAHNTFAICGVLRVGACRPCWEVLGVGVRSFSSGSNLAFRDSVTTVLHRDADHIKRSAPEC